jgi:hypothetical protein
VNSKKSTLPQTQKKPILLYPLIFHSRVPGTERFIVKSTFVFLLGVLVLSACSSSPMSKLQRPVTPLNSDLPSTESSTSGPNIIGNWRSVDAESFGKDLFMTREYHLTATRWELIRTFAEDKAMKHVIAISRTEGPYQMGTESSQPPKVWTIQLKVGSQGLVLKTKKGKWAKDLEINHCSLRYNHEKDISERGCGPFPSIKDCTQIYDIVNMDSNYLLFGAQGTDLKAACSESGRPTTLGLPLRKIN